MSRIDWKRFAIEIKRRRRQSGRSQDWLAAKIGVRPSTIARLESGDRLPSFPVLERLSSVFGCRIADLLREQAPPRKARGSRPPSLPGAPTYFRICVSDAKANAITGRDFNTGEPIVADFWTAGWHLAIHLDEYLSDEAREDLDQVEKLANAGEFAQELLDFLRMEFPGCMDLIPSEEIGEFMQGIYAAVDEGSVGISYDVSPLLIDSDEG